MKERIDRIYSREKADEYRAALDALDANGIDYILLNVLVADDNPGDLDVLLLRQSAKHVSAILSGQGFSYYCMYDSHQFLWNKYLKGVGFVQVHIYESVSYNGRLFLQNARIDYHSQEDGMFNLYIFLIESLYKYKLRTDQYLAYCHFVDVRGFHAYLKGLPGEELAEYMIDVYEGKKSLSTSARSHYFVKNNRFSSFIIKCRKAIRRFYRVFHNHDIEVLFLGVDGSGKTTVINGVKSIMAKGGLFPQIRYMGLRESVFCSRLGDNNEVDALEEKHYERPKLSMSLPRVLKVMLYWLEYNLKYLFLVRLCKKGSDTVFLIDRCYIDLLYYYPNRFVNRLYGKYAFMPKKIVFLTGDRETLFNRKKEMSRGKFDSLYSFYCDIADMIKHDKRNTYVVDTTQDEIQKTIHDICDFIVS